MFDHWHEYFLVTGGAAGALVGLLFVAATLTVRIDAERALRAAGIFMTPNIYHLSTVLVLSAAGTIPVGDGRVAAAIAGVLALAGVAFGAHNTLAFWRNPQLGAHWSDTWWYGVAPTVAHAVLGLAALAVAVRAPCAAGLFAASLMALILVAIRNAWDLVVWMSAKAEPTASD
jgi:hypothetical protein